MTQLKPSSAGGSDGRSPFAGQPALRRPSSEEGTKRSASGGRAAYSSTRSRETPFASSSEVERTRKLSVILERGEGGFGVGGSALDLERGGVRFGRVRGLAVQDEGVRVAERSRSSNGRGAGRGKERG
eukprot:scaffold859_cov132-Isochrysis_galbana.AAC.3